MKKLTYSLSEDFCLSLLNALVKIGDNEAKTDDEKEFMLDLISYIFYDLRIGKEK